MADPKTCSVPGCAKPLLARTWCNMHYTRWYKTGSLELPERIKPTCNAEECSDPVHSNGWCYLHYWRWWRNGTPELNVKTTEDAKGRILRQIAKDENGCWIWQGSKGGSGYGTVWWKKHQPAHRLSYEVHVGPIPKGLVIDHLCRVPLCVNPDHLEPVTQRENLRRGVAPNWVASRTDMCAKGLHPLAGENLYVQPDGRRNCRACRRERKAGV